MLLFCLKISKKDYPHRRLRLAVFLFLKNMHFKRLETEITTLLFKKAFS